MAAVDSQRLVALFSLLSAEDQATLLSFAEFLAGRTELSLPAVTPSVDKAEPVPEPKQIPRPDDERVVQAVKRLSKSYFMLDKREMLGVTSDLMTQHILQGRDAREVIDELETIFQEQYRKLQQEQD